MAFPATKLPITVELQINSVWTDISTDVRTQGGTDAIAISRGIKASGGRIADTATCAMTLDNNSGAYSNRNPLSPYYGYLGRNVPLRVSVAYGTPWLDCPYGVPNTASTPDAAVLDVTGDLDVRIDAELAVWGEQADPLLSVTELIGKYNVTGNQRSWRLTLTADGELTLTWSTDGTTTLSATSSRLGVAPNARLAVRATLDVNNGSGGWTVTFYTSTTAGTSGPWTQAGVTVSGTGTTSIFNSTAALNVGDIPALAFHDLTRKIYRAEVRNGIAGTIVANPNFEAQTVGATSFADTAPSARTWTATAGAISNKYLRFTGEVSEWPPQWDTGGKDVTTPITASGITQRYSQSKTNLQSPLRRALSTNGTVVAYWPMEEGSTATVAASPVAGVAPMRVTGFTWAADDSLNSSSPLPQLAPPSTLAATIPTMATGDWDVEFVFKLDTLPASPTLMFQVNLAGGTAATVQFLIGVAAARIRAVDSTGSVLGTADIPPTSFTAGWAVMSINTTTTGGTVALSASYQVIGDTNIWTVQAPYSGTPGRPISLAGTWDTPFADLRLGHVIVVAGAASAAFQDVDIAYDGEASIDRITRLAIEQGVPVSAAGSSETSELVGPQAIDTFLNLLTSATQADEGMLTEAREFIGLRFIGRAVLYNRPSGLDLPYVATPQALMAPLRPVEDLQGVLNDSTVTRLNGSFGRSVVTVGPLSVQEPPNGIGTGYDENLTLNLHTDDQAPYHAGWRTHIGTWNEARFPQVNISLEKNPTLIPQATRLDTGARMRITPPLIPHLPPDAIDQLVLGYDENIAQFSWRLSFACQPFGPYKVAVADDTVLGRAGTAGSQLNAGINSTVTSMQIATTSGPLWSIDPAQYPVDVRIGGEQITITAVTGASSPQTATVVRSVNTVVKVQTAGTAITLATPAVAAL